MAERTTAVIKTRIEEKERRFHKTALFSKTGNLVSTDAGPNLDEPLLSAHQFNPGGWTGGRTKVLQRPDRKEDEAQMCSTV